MYQRHQITSGNNSVWRHGVTIRHMVCAIDRYRHATLHQQAWHQSISSALLLGGMAAAITISSVAAQRRVTASMVGSAQRSISVKRKRMARMTIIESGVMLRGKRKAAYQHQHGM